MTIKINKKTKKQVIRIGIDINHVVRDINAAFVRAYDKEFRTDHRAMDAKERENMDIFSALKDFPFPSKRLRAEFFEKEYTYEIYASAVHSESLLPGLFSEWRRERIDYADEDIDLIFFTVGENELQYSSTTFFLAKGMRPKHIMYVDTPEEIWDVCDAIVTADKKVIEEQPDNKVSFLIKRDFNKSVQDNADYTYEYTTDMLKDKEFITKALTKTTKHTNKSWTKRIRRFLKG